MTMVRTLLYAPTPDVKERLVNRYGHHPAISFQATTDILDFFDRLHNADTVLLHHELPSRAASTLTRWLSAPRIGKPVIVVDVPPDPELIVRYYEVGASAYLLPGESAGKLHDVLGLLARGIPRIEDNIGSALLRRIARLRTLSRIVENRPYLVQLEQHRDIVDE